MTKFVRKQQILNSISTRYHSKKFVQIGHGTTYAAIKNHNFFNKACHRQYIDSILNLVKVGKSRKQNTKFSHTPKKHLLTFRSDNDMV